MKTESRQMGLSGIAAPSPAIPAHDRWYKLSMDIGHLLDTDGDIDVEAWCKRIGALRVNKIDVPKKAKILVDFIWILTVKEMAGANERVREVLDTRRSFGRSVLAMVTMDDLLKVYDHPDEAIEIPSQIQPIYSELEKIETDESGGTVTFKDGIRSGPAVAI